MGPKEEAQKHVGLFGIPRHQPCRVGGVVGREAGGGGAGWNSGGGGVDRERDKGLQLLEGIDAAKGKHHCWLCEGRRETVVR